MASGVPVLLNHTDHAVDAGAHIDLGIHCTVQRAHRCRHPAGMNGQNRLRSLADIHINAASEHIQRRFTGPVKLKTYPRFGIASNTAPVRRHKKPGFHPA